MKVAVVSTTINIPRAISVYLTFGPHISFFVAGDLRTPPGAVEFMKPMEGVHYFGPDEQKGWKSSELIGFSNDSRRNFAVLEAVRWGAEVLVSWDDDMLVQDDTFFAQIDRLFGEPWSGIKVGEPFSWMDHGQFSIPRAPARGLPIDFTPANCVAPVDRIKIGAAQGLILGVPDTDACTAIASRPIISGFGDVIRQGFVADPDCNAVFNSQLTAFRRELAPGFAQFYKWQGRNTDILASIIMRRMMQAMGLYTFYGPPMAFHARQPRPLFKDLKAEMFGLEHIVEFAEAVNDADILMEQSPVEMCRAIYESLRQQSWFAADNDAAASAWLDDIEGVL
jgi:hypothetical protein